MSEPDNTLAEHLNLPRRAIFLLTWFKIGILSFGGPAAQIALMHRIIVDEKKWLSEEQYLRALSFCMLLPGPEAMQLATYMGWRNFGVLGGLAAGLLFVLPGAVVVLTLCLIYTELGNVPVVNAVFFGIKAAVLVIVISALRKIANRALSHKEHWLVAFLSFAAIFFLALPYPLILLLAGLTGAAWVRGETKIKAVVSVSVTWKQTLRTAFLWLFIWIAPLVTLMLGLGRENVLTNISLFFSKLAVVTFGGAYAVLAYMAQAAVTDYGWLDAGEMMDGLGLAETTPGPLILVTEFVGFLAAYRFGGEPAWVFGILGVLVTLWMTFAPCFLWIFVGAPYLEWITSQSRLNGALTGITAAVVGFVAHLSLWFSLHVFFGDVRVVTYGVLELWTPTLVTLDWRVGLLACISAVLLLWYDWSIAVVLAVSAILAIFMQFGSI